MITINFSVRKQERPLLEHMLEVSFDNAENNSVKGRLVVLTNDL